MKKVILLCGPRGAGKSTYAEAVRVMHPEVKVVNRDRIAMRMFGGVSLNPYTGQHECVLWRLFERVSRMLAVQREDAVILLDCWNGYAHDRQNIIRRLKNYGADEVWAWYFLTSIDVSARWFYARESRNGLNEKQWKSYRERSYREDFLFFHKQASDLMEQYAAQGKEPDVEDDTVWWFDPDNISRFDHVELIHADQDRIPGMPFFPDVAVNEALCRYL